MRNNSYIIKLLVSMCFLLNTVLPNTALGISNENAGIMDDLAVPSIFDDLRGIEHKDIANIMLALQANLMSSGEEVLDIGSFKEDILLKEKTIFDPANIHFFYSGDGLKSLANGYVSVKCRVKNEGQELRTYHVVFSITKAGEGFPMEVFTENEWEKWEQLRDIIAFSGNLPERDAYKTEDAKAIGRYIQHEKSQDTVIRNLHEKDFVKKPLGSLFNYKKTITQLFKKLNVEVNVPEGLLPLEDREFYLVSMESGPDGLPDKTYFTTVIDEEGKEHEVSAFAHSSNNAVYVFLPRIYFTALTEEDIAGHYPFIGSDEKNPEQLRNFTSAYVERVLVHEIGVMLGCPVLSAEKQDPFTKTNPNLMDIRYTKPSPEPVKATVVDLDKNLLTRDYAAGENGKQAGYDDLTALEQKHIASVTIAAESGAKDLLRKINDASNGMDAGRPFVVKEKTVYQPLVMKFLIDSAEIIADKKHISIKCEVQDERHPDQQNKPAVSTYYAVFKPSHKAPFVEVLTKKEWRRVQAEEMFLSKRIHDKEKGEDVNAIRRNIAHEIGVDRIIREAHEKGLAKKPKETTLPFRAAIRHLYSVLNVDIENPEKLWPIEAREIFIIKKTPQIAKELVEYYTVVVDVDGKTAAISPAAHSSNYAIHLFVSEEEYDNYFEEKGPVWEEQQQFSAKEGTSMALSTYLWEVLAHEVGVICGLPMLSVDPRDEKRFLNEMDIRVRQARLEENIPPHKFFRITDLDTNLLTRDYAAGENEKQAGHDDLTALERKHIASITSAALTGMETLIGRISNAAGGMDDGKPFVAKEDTIYQPLIMTFDMRSVTIVTEGKYVYLKCEVQDERHPNEEGAAVSTYYVILKPFHEKPAIEVFTGREWRRIRAGEMSLSRGHDKGEDEDAIYRYISHELGLDRIIREAHEKGLAKRPKETTLPFRVAIQHLYSILNVNIQNPEKLWPIEEREFFIIKKTPEIEKELSEHYMFVADVHGNSTAIIPSAHSSNYAVHLFVDEEAYENYFEEKGPVWEAKRRAEEEYGIAIALPTYLWGMLAHEVGVMCGLPMLVVDPGDEKCFFNEMDIRLKEGFLEKKELPHAFLQITDLDKNLLTRDYAAADDQGKRDMRRKSRIKEMTVLARETGVEISRPVLEKNYTLITCGDFFKDEKEREGDMTEYGSVFNLEWIKPARPETTIDRIIDMVTGKNLDPNNVMVQLPKVFSEEQYQGELTRLLDGAPGIKFMVVDTQGLKGEANSFRYRTNIYGMMVLARKINTDTPKNSRLYGLLEFFITSCLGDENRALAEGYINALIRNDITLIVRTILSYKPMEQYDMPDYDKVSATLIAA
ncbi:MAG: hypothetical protein ABIA77_07015 [Candidatus Omnitrophota bacterium]